MAIIHNLVAKFRADTGTFDRNVKKSRAHMNRFGRDVTSMSRQMRSFTRRIMIAAGVTGLGYMIKQTMASIDATAKLSDRLGVTTKKLVGLQHAASITGTGAEILNKSLEMFTRRLGEMTQGSGEAKRGLDMLGLTSEQLIHKSPAEAFGIAADRIKQLGTQAEKTAAAYYLFGRSGSQLVNMLEVGSEGLREFQKEAEKLGLTFSRFDAAQVEAANDALTRARAVMTGLARQATIQLAPYIEAAANSFINFATAGEGVGKNVVNVFENISLSAVRLGGYLSSLPAYWKGFEAAAHQSLAVVYDIADAATNLDVLFKKLGRPGWEKTYKELAEEQRQIAEGLLEAGGAQLAGTYGQENAVKRYYEGLRKAAAGRQAMIESKTPGLVPQTQVPSISTEDIQSFVQQTREAIESVRHMDYLTRMERIKNLRIYAEENAAILDQVKQANELLNAEILSIERSRANQLSIYLAKLREDAQNTGLYLSDKFAEVATSIEGSLGNAFYNMIAEGKNFRDAMKGFAQDVMRSFARMFAEIAARQMMYAVLGPAMGPLMYPGMYHRGGIVGQATQRRLMPAATFIGAPRLHDGLAADEYPAILERGEQVVPRGGGGVGTAPTIIINNQTGQRMRQEGEPMFDGRQWVIRVVADDIQNHGVLGKMLGRKK